MNYTQHMFGATGHHASGSSSHLHLHPSHHLQQQLGNNSGSPQQQQRRNSRGGPHYIQQQSQLQQQQMAGLPYSPNAAPLHSPNAPPSGSAQWTPVTIYCAAVRYQTTLATLQQFPHTQLCRLFSPPFPLYDAANDAHMLPLGLCPDPAIFSCILEFLRTRQWMMPPDAALYDAVCEAAAALEIPSRPPQLLRGDGGDGLCRYEHQTVRLPVPHPNSRGNGGGRGIAAAVMSGSDDGAAGGGSGGAPVPSSVAGLLSRSGSGTKGVGGFSRTNSRPKAAEPLAAAVGSPARRVHPPPPYDPAMNTAEMLSLLGYKGFAVISEGKGIAADGSYTTEVTLRRKVPAVRGVEMLAEESPLFQRLLSIV